MVHRRDSVLLLLLALHMARHIAIWTLVTRFPMASSPEDFAAKMREEKGYGENVGVFVVGMG